MATFDSTIHFYSLRPGQAQPHMLVVPDTTDVYCPLAGNVVVNLKQSRELVSGCCGLVSCGSWGCCVWVHPKLSEAAGVGWASVLLPIRVRAAVTSRHLLAPRAPLQVGSLLESIPRMFQDTQVMETCGGAALKRWGWGVQAVARLG